MTREIKFRAYIKELDEIFPVNKINFLSGLVIVGTRKPHKPVQEGTDSVKLMQYTELKDKNGKEIYEGDVVKTENGFEYKIEWSGGGFFMKRTDNELMYGRFECYGDIEIIGNIYTNPNLLTN